MLQSSNEILEKLRWMPAPLIYDGAYWTLLTSVFFHGFTLHLLFNVYWIYRLGEVMELKLGPKKFTAFFLLAAFVTSGFELMISGSTGIGLSGVVYAIFGYMWMAYKYDSQFWGVIDQSVIQLMTIWLVVCLALHGSGWMNIGNAAHFSGVAFGAAVALFFVAKKERPWYFLALILLIGLPLADLIFGPLLP
jgi:rhomboid protease GluP